MRTPADWQREYPELVSKELISEIQRDAREGMVDREEVMEAINEGSNCATTWVATVRTCRN